MSTTLISGGAGSSGGTASGDVGTLDQLDLANSNPLAVAVVDGNGDQITSFGGGTQYTEDAAAAANPVGNATILVRQDTPGTLVTTDGDNVAQRGTNYGAAYTQIVSSTGSFVDTFGGGTQYTEDAAAAANPTGTAVSLVRQDTPAALVTTDGDNVAQRGTNFGAAYTQVVTSTGSFVDTFGGGQQYADAAVRGTATGTLAMGDDGTNIQSVHVDTAGDLQIDVLTSALPSGAATSAKQDTEIASLASIDAKFPTAAGSIDNLGDPTVTKIATVGYGWDGVAWDRLRNTSADGLLVNLGTNNDVKWGDNTTVTPGNITGAGQDMTLAGGSGYNYAHVRLRGSAIDGFVGTIEFHVFDKNDGLTRALGIAYNQVTGKWIDSIDLSLAAGDFYNLVVMLRPTTTSGLVTSNSAAIHCSAYTSGTLTCEADFTLATFVPNTLTNLEFQDRINTLGQKVMAASTPVVLASDQSTIFVSDTNIDVPLSTLATDLAEINASLPATAVLADNTANPTISKIQTFPMLWDGATWDRSPGDSVNGALVNTELPAAAALADDTANPTAPAVGAFSMIWDGVTWDRLPGNSSSGAVVNTEMASAITLSDSNTNPVTAPVGAFLSAWNGATWSRSPGTSTDGLLVNLGANNDVILNANSGVDVGDVTINNAAGASAVNIQDGGNSITVDGPLTNAELRAAPVDITGAISATSAATATAEPPTYTEGTPEDLSQDLGGRLRVLSHALVDDSPQAYVVGDVKILSMTPEGRLRVSASEPRIAEAPFSDAMRNMWGDLRPWDNGSGKSYYDGSPWNAW